MNETPLVCICIPNYNNEKTIAQTLDSLLNQTYQNMIIKIFDNASTDDSMKILREYEEKYPHIQVFQNETNIGGEANFTKCIENMEGEYSAIYHADDIYMPTIVEEEVKALEENNISAVFTNANIIDGNGKIQSKIKIPDEFLNDNFYTEITFFELIKSNMKNDNFLVCPTAMSETKTYQKYIVNWDSSIYKTATDISIWLKFATLAPVALITKELINYRYSFDSFSYRRLKTRLERKDYFLVIDDFIKREDVKNNLTDNDYRYYKFLKFKDDIVITKNSIINGSIILNSISAFDMDVIKISLSSKKYFIYYWIGLFFKVISFKNYAAKLIRFLRK